MWVREEPAEGESKQWAHTSWSFCPFIVIIIVIDGNSHIMQLAILKCTTQ